MKAWPVKSNVVIEDLENITKRLSSELIQMEGKTVYITGGGGFLGYYLVQTLLYWNQQATKKIKVVVADNNKLKNNSWLSFFKASEELQYIEFDVTKGMPAQVRPHFIIHGASIASPIFYRKFPIETIDANITGLRILLDYSLENHEEVESLLYFSSSEIYGDPPADKIPTSEDFWGYVSCNGPRACYDESKRLCEALCASFFQQHKTPVKIVRPFNNYGPGLSPLDGRVLADFARSIIQNEDLKMYSDGTPRRTFCYIADAVVGYLKALVIGIPSSAYNIGTDLPEVSMRELAELTQKIARDDFKSTTQIHFEISKDVNYLTNNPQRRCPNIDKARSELNFEPQFGLEKGVRNYIQWSFDWKNQK